MTQPAEPLWRLRASQDSARRSTANLASCRHQAAAVPGCDAMVRDSSTPVLVEHDDGQHYVARVLDQYRDRHTGAWRVVVTYSTGPGSTYIKAEPADRCRPLRDGHDDQPDDAPAGHPHPDGQNDPAWVLVARDHDRRR